MYWERILFPDKDPTQKAGFLNDNYNFTYAWTDLAFFSANASFDISVEKYVNMLMTGYYGDDDWDAVGNPISNWAGSLTMRYTYDIQNGTQPVPEPSTVCLLGIGLVGLGVLRRKGRR